jgi:hypothetical protein
VNSTEDENLTAADTNPPPPLEPNPASTTTPTSKEVRGPAPALNRKQRRKAEFRSQKILTFKRKEFQAFKENQEAEAEKKRQKKKATAKMKAKARR